MRLRDKADIAIRYDHVHVSLDLDKADTAEVVNFFQGLKADVEYDLQAKERARRSLSTNAYHWALVNKLADAMGVSNYEIHNQLLCDYGEDWLDEGLQQTYVLMKDDDRYRRMETTHYRPTDHTEDRHGVIYRWFVLLLPSHLMNKSQMARLIEGTIAECEAVGIETKSKDEIDRMVEKWAE